MAFTAQDAVNGLHLSLLAQTNCGLFADRETIHECDDYMFRISNGKDYSVEIITPYYILKNTICKIIRNDKGRVLMRQAREALLDPDLAESERDEIVSQLEAYLAEFAWEDSEHATHTGE